MNKYLTECYRAMEYLDQCKKRAVISKDEGWIEHGEGFLLDNYNSMMENSIKPHFLKDEAYYKCKSEVERVLNL